MRQTVAARPDLAIGAMRSVLLTGSTAALPISRLKLAPSGPNGSFPDARNSWLLPPAMLADHVARMEGAQARGLELDSGGM
jgi:hypothetical protein